MASLIPGRLRGGIYGSISLNSHCNTMKHSLIIVIVMVVCGTPYMAAQPLPGDVFREYVWLPTMVREKEKFLRVGGRFDYQIHAEHMDPSFHEEGFLLLDDSLDLDKAVRAEVILEMVQSHEDTRGLAITLNHRKPISVPDLPELPKPQSANMLHSYPSVEIPLQDLISGYGNQFRLTVDSTQKWNWPQNIFYGVTLRIYYSADELSERTTLAGVSDGDQLGENINLGIFNQKDVYQVDYIGLYEDYDWEGNGKFRQWHGHMHRGVLRNHIGTSNEAPFSATWQLDWLPDQSEPISIMARVELEDGLMYMTEAIEKLTLERSFSVELCKPYHQPENWVTRQDTFEAGFAVHGDLDQAEFYQVAWRSWSPCYGRGLFINDQKIWDKEDPCYGYAEHQITIDDTEILKYGENIIRTGMTPLINEKMVHGMEVQYPGVMVKVKYSKPNQEGVSISEGSYEGRPHFIVMTMSAIYYYDRAGGGLSRMIDRSGKDWIDFRREPWGEYPASAASAYRGIPNFVHGSDDSGAGHPGHDRCTSEVLNDSTIYTRSKSGLWKWQWTFSDKYARVEMLKTDPEHPYWFLYEGVPGGRFNPKDQYFGTSSGGPRFNQLDFYKGSQVFESWDWAYFGKKDISRVLFVVQQSSDDLMDTFGYLGNTKSGIESNDGMVVFGFGREKGAKPVLKKRNSFILGFIEKEVNNEADHQDVSRTLSKIK